MNTTKEYRDTVEFIHELDNNSANGPPSWVKMAPYQGPRIRHPITPLALTYLITRFFEYENLVARELYISPLDYEDLQKGLGSDTDFSPLTKIEIVTLTRLERGEAFLTFPHQDSDIVIRLNIEHQDV